MELTPEARAIHIMSDGTGETAEKVVRAALRQFRGQVVKVTVHGNVTGMDALPAILRQVAIEDGLLVSTLVSADMRIAVAEAATKHNVRHTDILGNVLDQLGSFLHAKPAGVPGLLHEVNDRYFRRIEAVEFTVKADDGKEPRMLSQADIILVGVSRTSKTPLSTFLAHKGFKVGNVPLVLDKPPPSQLFEVDQNKIFALDIDPEILRNIRHERIRAMGLSSATSYSDLDYILAELEFARDLFAGNPEWPVIEVTNRALEETAATILRIYADRGYTLTVGDVGQL